MAYKSFKELEKELRANPSRRSRVLGTIKEYYGNYIVADKVRATPVDKRLYEQKTKFGINDEYVKEIHDKYSITYFRNWSDFMQHRKDFQMTDEQLQALWIEYEHREQLIITGQYDTLRIEMFRENYIKGMKRLGMSKKEIEQFKSLTNSELDLLVKYPTTSKEQSDGGFLPELGLFQYDDKNYRERVRGEMQYAFGLIDREFEPSDDDDTAMFDKHKNKKVLTTKPNKKGETHRYIPGVGSETGKNAALIDQIIEYQRKR